MHQFSFCRHRPVFRPRRTVKYFSHAQGGLGAEKKRMCPFAYSLPGGRHPAGRLVEFCRTWKARGNFISYYAAELFASDAPARFGKCFLFAVFVFLCLSLLLLFAFSCFGAPCVIGLLWVEGCAFGAMNAALQGRWAPKGLFASAVLFLVPESVRFVCFTLTARRALQTSASLFAAHSWPERCMRKQVLCALRIYMAASIACMASAFLAGALSAYLPCFF